jgi:hypothetical protein
MSNPSLPEPQSTNSTLNQTSILQAYDDEDDEADYDDDEEEGSPSLPQECWFSRSGFGSPQWWSRA